ncbi:MAG: ribulose-phosphate 3-epimerase [Candidatus Woesearchaeota archaeon]
MREIVASIIADNQEELDNILKKLSKNVQRIQLDVMDGMFVSSEVFDFDFKIPDNLYKIEAHLMTINPEMWIEDNNKKVETIIVHIESCNDPQKVINYVKDKGNKIGFALRPETPVEAIMPYLNQLNIVLVFTADVIGYYGAKFNPKSINKIKKIRKNSAVTIEVDGGITPKNILELEKAGADRFVVGSYLQKAKNIKKALQMLRG